MPETLPPAPATVPIDAAGLAPRQAYQLLTGVVVPRPIAWVLTRSPAGVTNLAPFSAFTFVSDEPPMVGVNIGPRPDGTRKDTARNIADTGEYVVHIADGSLLGAMHASAAEYPPAVSEVERLGLALGASTRIAVPRLAAARVALECRLHRVERFGRSGSEFVVGEVLVFHVRDDLLDGLRVDARRLDPVCRLGGPNYATLGPVTTLPPAPVEPA